MSDDRINQEAFREWMTDISCSVCSADIGEGCRGGTGQIHLARALAAQEVAAKSDDHLRHGPWKWDDIHPEAGLWCEVEHPLICDYHLNAFQIPPLVTAATEAAPELIAALKKAIDMVRWLAPFALQFAPTGSNLPTAAEVDEVYRGAHTLIDRIAKAGS
jgi:hypothetical protein